MEKMWLTEMTTQTKLIDAIINKDTLAVMRLLQAGACPQKALDSANVTPLHFAAQQNAVDIIKILLKAGADLTATTLPDGQTAYDIAQLHGHQAALQLLKQPI